MMGLTLVSLWVRENWSTCSRSDSGGMLGECPAGDLVG